MSQSPSEKPSVGVAARQLTLDFEKAPLQLLGVDDIYEYATERLLHRLQEDRRIERKSSKFSGDSLGEYFSMWANTAPEGGLIVLGQTDDGPFEGCAKLSEEALNQ